MSDNENKTAERRVQISFVNCFDATAFAGDVLLTCAEEAELRNLLLNLEASGILLVPSATITDAGDLEGMLVFLRRSLGDPFVEAALGRGSTQAPSGGRPAALMPVWQFQPEGDDPEDRDVLLSSGMLWGGDVLIEALRVESAERPVPVTVVRPRYDRWMKAAGGGHERQVVFPPGEHGAYVLLAAAAPA